MNGLDFLLDPPAKRFSEWAWATVTHVKPLRIRLDGDIEPLSGSPTLMFSGSSLSVGTRVRVHIDKSRALGQVGAHIYVFGVAGGANWGDVIDRIDQLEDEVAQIQNPGGGPILEVPSPCGGLMPGDIFYPSADTPYLGERGLTWLWNEVTWDEFDALEYPGGDFVSMSNGDWQVAEFEPWHVHHFEPQGDVKAGHWSLGVRGSGTLRLSRAAGGVVVMPPPEEKNRPEFVTWTQHTTIPVNSDSWVEVTFLIPPEDLTPEHIPPWVDPPYTRVGERLHIECISGEIEMDWANAVFASECGYNEDTNDATQSDWYPWIWPGTTPNLNEVHGIQNMHWTWLHFERDIPRPETPTKYRIGYPLWRYRGMPRT